MSIFIEYNYLMELCDALMDGHITYGMGAKAPLDAQPADIRRIDCSGFTRYLIYQATDHEVKLVDGSDEQHAWCRKHKLASEDYMKSAASKDGKLRIAFIPRLYADGKLKKAGHVWLVHNGLTMESHGGVGPSRRPWNSSPLTSRVNGCYVLARLYSMTLGPITTSSSTSTSTH